MNQKEAPQPIDIKSLKDFNSFYRYLPDGDYRLPDYATPQTEKLISDLDQEAGKLGIDTKLIYKEIRKGNGIIMEAINSNKPDAEAQKIADEGNKIRNEAHKKLIPLFEALVKLGYNPTELMS